MATVTREREEQDAFDEQMRLLRKAARHAEYRGDDAAAEACRWAESRMRHERAAALASAPPANKVGCERPDGTLNVHAESETCEVCAPPAAPPEDARDYEMYGQVLREMAGQHDSQARSAKHRAEVLESDQSEGREGLLDLGRSARQQQAYHERAAKAMRSGAAALTAASAAPPAPPAEDGGICSDCHTAGWCERAGCLAEQNASDARQRESVSMRLAPPASAPPAAPPEDALRAAVLACLRNMGHDTTCGACMEIAFAGMTSAAHSCAARQSDPPGPTVINEDDGDVCIDFDFANDRVVSIRLGEESCGYSALIGRVSSHGLLDKLPAPVLALLRTEAQSVRLARQSDPPGLVAAASSGSCAIRTGRSGSASRRSRHERDQAAHRQQQPSGDRHAMSRHNGRDAG